ncbi:hypothetical protein SLEP1_g41843 [Rubroshorea leprosula]|nr:hypothetical protein SLEP1_g41843 [Rubroshorea leprosula]
MVEGNDEEDDIDDLENEFSLNHYVVAPDASDLPHNVGIGTKLSRPFPCSHPGNLFILCTIHHYSDAPINCCSWLSISHVVHHPIHDVLICSATHIPGPFQGLGSLWIRQCCLESEDGEWDPLKRSRYVSDAAAVLTFEALSETFEFARKWREYEEFKVRINALVGKAKNVPEEGWTLQDGSPCPGNNIRDQSWDNSGRSGGHDINGNELPSLVYVSREKRPGLNHHRKAGAMNALVRVSVVLTNAPYPLNLDCDHYINNSKALREAMCFMMDPLLGKRVCYVRFPWRFDGIDRHNQYADRNAVFFDINMTGLDGIQGPIYFGTGRKKKTDIQKSQLKKRNGKKGNTEVIPSSSDGPKEDIAGKEGEKYDVPEPKLEMKFGQSPVFVASTLPEDGRTLKGVSPASLLKEAIHVISCGYEDKTEWGKEVLAGVEINFSLTSKAGDDEELPAFKWKHCSSHQQPC